METDEKRAYVRGDMAFEVEFNLISPEQYAALQNVKAEKSSLFQEKRVPEAIAEEICAHMDTDLANYLLHLDRKLDRILSLLSKPDVAAEPAHKAYGVDISGSGMKLVVDHRFESNRLIQATIIVPKCSLVLRDILGRIVSINKKVEAGQQRYELGVRFLDMDSGERKRIISAVFQRQRELIRGKNKVHNPIGIEVAG